METATPTPRDEADGAEITATSDAPAPSLAARRETPPPRLYSPQSHDSTSPAALPALDTHDLRRG